MGVGNYKNYQNARNASWQALIDFNVTSLPVFLRDIFNQLQIKVNSYKNGHALIQEIGLSENMVYDGFSVSINNQWFVFYSDNQLRARSRFTLAHELGHILLGHKMRTKQSCFGRLDYTVINDGQMHEDNLIEYEANLFASRFLAPAIVLHDLNITNAKSISELTGLSYTAAQYRAERMQILNSRNRFCTNPLEKQVQSQFNDFVKRYKKNG